MCVYVCVMNICVYEYMHLCKNVCDNVVNVYKVYEYVYKFIKSQNEQCYKIKRVLFMKINVELRRSALSSILHNIPDKNIVILDEIRPI